MGAHPGYPFAEHTDKHDLIVSCHGIFNPSQPMSYADNTSTQHNALVTI